MQAEAARGRRPPSSPVLREKAGGDPVARRLAIDLHQPVRRGIARAGMADQMMLCPRAMQIDDPGQDLIAAQIDRRQRPAGQPSVGQCDGALLQHSIAQDRGAGQSQREQKGHSPSGC